MARTKKESVDAVEENVAVEKTVTLKKDNSYWKELIDVKFPKIRGVKEQPDVIIGVNNRSWQIKRGISVKIPRYALVAYNESQNAMDDADEYIQGSALSSAD